MGFCSSSATPRKLQAWNTIEIAGQNTAIAFIPRRRGRQSPNWRALQGGADFEFVSSELLMSSTFVLDSYFRLGDDGKSIKKSIQKSLCRSE
jgi:hypothetical protein